MTTLRLEMPQWQGAGDVPELGLGGRLTAFLAGSADDVERIDVPATAGLSGDGEPIVAAAPLLAQLEQARAVLDRRAPERIAVVGGDCSVELAPVAYLNERHAGRLSLLWIDAHPDLNTPQSSPSATLQGMPLRLLLGEGDGRFLAHVAHPLRPQQVLLVGTRAHDPDEDEYIARHDVGHVAVGDLADGSEPVLDWLAAREAPVYVHLDLDALDPGDFASLGWPEPDGLRLETVSRLLREINAQHDVVGFGVTEYLPRDAAALQRLLRAAPLLGGDPV